MKFRYRQTIRTVRINRNSLFTVKPYQLRWMALKNRVQDHYGCLYHQTTLKIT